MNPTIINEILKLRASWLNTLAAATISIGVIAPIAAFLYGSTQPTASVYDMAILTGAFVSAGWFLHLSAQLVLTELVVR
jgi:hypothetical protein